MAAEGTSEILQVMEVLLTAEVFNRNRDLDENDLTPRCREAFGMGADGQVKRPVTLTFTVGGTSSQVRPARKAKAIAVCSTSPSWTRGRRW